MSIQRETSAFPIGGELLNLLVNELGESGDLAHKPLTINFRDPTYSAEKGGYRPVEIRVGKGGRVEYITEFSYMGLGDFAELGKSSDFDFSQGVYQNEYRTYPITAKGVEQFYRVWESNFCSYIKARVFRVQITKEDE